MWNILPTLPLNSSFCDVSDMKSAIYHAAQPIGCLLGYFFFFVNRSLQIAAKALRSNIRSDGLISILAGKVVYLLRCHSFLFLALMQMRQFSSSLGV